MRAHFPDGKTDEEEMGGEKCAEKDILTCLLSQCLPRQSCVLLLLPEGVHFLLSS